MTTTSFEQPQVSRANRPKSPFLRFAKLGKTALRKMADYMRADGKTRDEAIYEDDVYSVAYLQKHPEKKGSLYRSLLDKTLPPRPKDNQQLVGRTLDKGALLFVHYPEETAPNQTPVLSFLTPLLAETDKTAEAPNPLGGFTNRAAHQFKYRRFDIVDDPNAAPVVSQKICMLLNTSRGFLSQETVSSQQNPIPPSELSADQLHGLSVEIPRIKDWVTLK